MFNDNRENQGHQAIDMAATLRAIKDDGFMVTGWCRRRGFHIAHLHMVLKGLRGGTKRVSPVADKIVEALREDGYLRFKDVVNG